MQGRARARVLTGAREARRAGFRGRVAQAMQKDARGRAVGNVPHLHSAGAKEPGGQTREERGPHSAHAQVVSRDRASRAGSQDPVVRGQVDFQSRAGRAAARIAVAPGLAASGRADGNSQIERPWNGE